MRRLIVLLLFAAFALSWCLFLQTSCISIQPHLYEKPPENIRIPSLKSEGIFVYTEKEYARRGAEHAVLIQGKIKNPDFSLKDFLSVSAVKKKIWDCTISSGERTIGIQCDLTVCTTKEGRNDKFDIAPVSFEGSRLEFSDAISEYDVPIPYMIAKFHDAEGRCYKVFAMELTKYTPSNSKCIVMDKKQEFFILFEGTVAARFSSSQYKIYSDEEPELLEKYASVLNAVFRGVQKYEKSLLLR